MKYILKLFIYLSPILAYAQKDSVSRDSLERSKDIGYQIGYFVTLYLPYFILCIVFIAFLIHQRNHAKKKM